MFKMKHKVKKRVIVACVIVTLVIVLIVMFQMMNKKTEQALKNQINVELDMKQVKDGTYQGSSDGGMVYVEVEVVVKNHEIQEIQLLKHENALGKPAEAMIDDMILNNTDDVDTVSGATASSKTIRNAVNNALIKGLE